MSAFVGHTRAERICAVAAAAAHDLNEELSIILSALQIAIRETSRDHPARGSLLDIQCSAQRCAWKASGLLNYSARFGAEGSAATMERLVDNDASSATGIL